MSYIPFAVKIKLSDHYLIDVCIFTCSNEIQSSNRVCNGVLSGSENNTDCYPIYNERRLKIDLLNTNFNDTEHFRRSDHFCNNFTGKFQNIMQII